MKIFKNDPLRWVVLLYVPFPSSPAIVACYLCLLYRDRIPAISNLKKSNDHDIQSYVQIRTRQGCGCLYRYLPSMAYLRPRCFRGDGYSPATASPSAGCCSVYLREIRYRNPVKTLTLQGIVGNCGNTLQCINLKPYLCIVFRNMMSRVEAS